MTTTLKPPPKELKPAGWGLVTLTAIAAVLGGLASAFQGISSDKLNRPAPGATSFEQGEVVGQFMGRGLGAAIFFWFALWLFGKLTRRRVGWRAFLIIAAVAIAANLALMIALNAARPA